MAISLISTRNPGAPATTYHPHLQDLIDIDGNHPQVVQFPSISIEIRNPTGPTTYVQTFSGTDSLVRQNSFDQRSQSVDLVLHEVSDWIHPNGNKPIRSMYRLVVHEGYHGITTQTFNGWITKVDYSNFPKEVRITASDWLYFARRFYVMSPLDYQSWNPENAVRDVLSRCGIPSDVININVDGSQSFLMPVLPSYVDATGRVGAVFSYESAESILQHICNLYGYRFWCTVGGLVEFQYIRPFPQGTPTYLPATPSGSGNRYYLHGLSGAAAIGTYGGSPPGNLLKVNSHSYQSDDLRNFVGVFDGTDAPLYVNAAPAVAGYPAPKHPSITGFGSPPNDLATQAALYAATHNANLVSNFGYFTASMVAASDLIGWGLTVRAHPDNPGDSSTTTAQNFLAQRILADLNIETEVVDVVLFGNPYIDIGQTIYLHDDDAQLDGLFFIQSFQTRISSAGYTTQIKCTGGPTWNVTYPQPRPVTRHTKTHSGGHIAHVSIDQGWAASSSSYAYSLTTATGPY